MQFAIGSVFSATPDWGDRFRAREVRFPDHLHSALFRQRDGRSWTIRGAMPCRSTRPSATSVLRGVRRPCTSRGPGPCRISTRKSPTSASGIFPYPNESGDARLIFEPNMTFMKSSRTTHADAVDQVLHAIFESKDLASEIFDFTKTSSLLKNIGPEVPLLIQSDIDGLPESRPGRRRDDGQQPADLVLPGKSGQQDVRLAAGQVEPGSCVELRRPESLAQRAVSGLRQRIFPLLCKPFFPFCPTSVFRTAAGLYLQVRILPKEESNEKTSFHGPRVWAWRWSLTSFPAWGQACHTEDPGRPIHHGRRHRKVSSTPPWPPISHHQAGLGNRRLGNGPQRQGAAVHPVRPA